MKPERLSKTIVIPELEVAAKTFQEHKNKWSEEEVAILEKYYNRVAVQKLAKYLHRSTVSIRDMAARYKIMERRASGELE